MAWCYSPGLKKLAGNLKNIQQHTTATPSHCDSRQTLHAPHAPRMTYSALILQLPGTATTSSGARHRCHRMPTTPQFHSSSLRPLTLYPPCTGGSKPMYLWTLARSWWARRIFFRGIIGSRDEFREPSRHVLDGAVEALLGQTFPVPMERMQRIVLGGSFGVGEIELSKGFRATGLRRGGCFW